MSKRLREEALRAIQRIGNPVVKSSGELTRRKIDIDQLLKNGRDPSVILDEMIFNGQAAIDAARRGRLDITSTGFWNASGYARALDRSNPFTPPAPGGSIDDRAKREFQQSTIEAGAAQLQAPGERAIYYARIAALWLADNRPSEAAAAFKNGLSIVRSYLREPGDSLTEVGPAFIEENAAVLYREMAERMPVRRGGALLKALYQDAKRLRFPGPRALVLGPLSEELLGAGLKAEAADAARDAALGAQQIAVRVGNADENSRSRALADAATTLARLGSLRSARLASEGCSTPDRMAVYVEILRFAVGPRAQRQME
ncbi:MAG: hypothetical protein ACLQGP_04890 [Isosphaeraceae bacterium]